VSYLHLVTFVIFSGPDRTFRQVSDGRARDAGPVTLTPPGHQPKVRQSFTDESGVLPGSDS
jgi:hypothetical protein